jgi:signal transduction histidine kinase
MGYGKGLDLSKNYYDGNGMKNMKNRIQQINGQLDIKNVNGLTLIFEIPIKSIL